MALHAYIYEHGSTNSLVKTNIPKTKLSFDTLFGYISSTGLHDLQDSEFFLPYHSITYSPLSKKTKVEFYDPLVSSVSDEDIKQACGIDLENISQILDISMHNSHNSRDVEIFKSKYIEVFRACYGKIDWITLSKLHNDKNPIMFSQIFNSVETMYPFIGKYNTVFLKSCLSRINVTELYYISEKIFPLKDTNFPNFEEVKKI